MPRIVIEDGSHCWQGNVKVAGIRHQLTFPDDSEICRRAAIAFEEIRGVRLTWELFGMPEHLWVYNNQNENT